MDPLEIVASTADAAFGTDEEGRIVLWNRAAERLLGYGPSQILGRPCHEVLCGKDIFDNRFCDEGCALVAMARRHEPVRRFEMVVRSEAGRGVPVELSVVVVPGPRAGQYTMLHLMKEVAAFTSIGEGSDARADPRTEARPEAIAPVDNPLTPREAEVLRRLADGLATQEIADALCISVVTVRNHVQNILRKLGVHSKLEAVSLALRRRLL